MNHGRLKPLSSSDAYSSRWSLEFCWANYSETARSLQMQSKRAHSSDTALLLFCCTVRLGATEWQVYGMKFCVQTQTNRICYERAIRFTNLILLQAYTFRTRQNLHFHVQSMWQHRRAVYMNFCERLHKTQTDHQSCCVFMRRWAQIPPRTLGTLTSVSVIFLNRYKKLWDHN